MIGLQVERALWVELHMGHIIVAVTGVVNCRVMKKLLFLLKYIYELT